MSLISKFKNINLQDNFYLRIANKKDMKFRPSLINDKETNKTLLMEPTVTILSSEIWLKTSLKKNFLPLTITNHDGEVCGMTGLTQVDYFNKRAQFYISMDKFVRGKGLASIIIKKILAYAKKNKFKKIYLFTLKNNSYARRIYEKNGFKFEAELKKHFYKNKIFHNVYLHSIIF